MPPVFVVFVECLIYLERCGNYKNNNNDCEHLCLSPLTEIHKYIVFSSIKLSYHNVKAVKERYIWG